MLRHCPLRMIREKNKLNNPKDRNIRMLPALRAELDACPSGQLVYLATEFGRPYASPKAFGNRFKAWCKQAGLPHCSAHGLRKAAATFAAEDGATAHELMALFGWTTLKQAENYTRKADKKKLGDSGMNHMDQDYTANESVPPETGVEADGPMKGKKAC